jgi:hypothetical protein
MPLINLTTDLKSLRYGSDRLGGGNSGQPFIETPIPDQNSQSTTTFPFISLAQINQTVANQIGINQQNVNPLENQVSIGAQDGFVRGGITTAAARAYIDATRVNNFLQTAAGDLFMIKQNRLSDAGVLTQGGGAFKNDHAYNSLSLKNQVAGNAFGLHLLKQTTGDFNPFELLEGEADLSDLPFLQGREGKYFFSGRYISAVDPFVNPTIELNKNRLVALSRLFNTFYLSEDEKLSGTINIGPGAAGITLNEGGNIMTYSNGPSNPLGGGLSTNIRFADNQQRTGENNPFLINSGFFGEGFGGTLQGGSFSLLRVARQGASFVQGGLNRLGRRKGFLGFVSNALSSQIPSLFDRGAREIDDFIQTRLSTALGFENLQDQSNFSVFTHPTPTFNFINYIRLSNVFGAIQSDPRFFNETFNAINPDGSRGTTFDFNVYQGNGDISVTNDELQNKNKGATWTQKQILEAPDLIIPGTIGQDFRQKIIEERGQGDVKKVISTSPNYARKNFMIRTNVGDPGDMPVVPGGTERFDYGVDASTLKALDKLNALAPYSGDVDSTKPINDFVKLRFRVMSSTGNSIKYNLHFRSLINNFSDSYNSSWNSVKYAGRADNFYNYTGFNRQLAFGFTVAALSKAELIPMYKKLNHLVSTLAPSYDSTRGSMRGTLIKFSMGGYVHDIPGFLTSCNITVPQESPYEIGIDSNGNGDDSVAELPLIVNVECQFTPIHDFLVETADSATNPNAKFISLANGESSNLYGATYNAQEKYQGNNLESNLSNFVESKRFQLAGGVPSTNIDFSLPGARIGDASANAFSFLSDGSLIENPQRPRTEFGSNTNNNSFERRPFGFQSPRDRMGFGDFTTG